MTNTIFNLVYIEDSYSGDQTIVFAFTSEAAAEKYLENYPEEQRRDYEIVETETYSEDTEWFAHYEGKLTTLNSPNGNLKLGTEVTVLFVDDMESKLAIHSNYNRFSLTQMFMYSTAPSITVSGTNKDEVTATVNELKDELLRFRATIKRDMGSVMRTVVSWDEELLNSILDRIS